MAVYQVSYIRGLGRSQLHPGVMAESITFGFSLLSQVHPELSTKSAASGAANSPRRKVRFLCRNGSNNKIYGDKRRRQMPLNDDGSSYNENDDMKDEVDQR